MELSADWKAWRFTFTAYAVVSPDMKGLMVRAVGRSQSERIENAGTSQRHKRCCRVEMVGEREHEPDSAGCHSSLLWQIVSYSLRGSAALEQRLSNL